MKKKAARMACIAIACLILGSLSGEVYASTISEIKKQQEEDKKKLNSVQGEISGLEGEQSGVGEEIEEIDAELVQIIASVDLIKEEIVEKEGQIEETEAEYEAAKQQEEEQYETMKIRIKFMYEQGDISYVQLFMSSESFADMLNKADYVEQLYTYDRKMLEEYQAAKEYAQQVWDKLEEEKSELVAAQHELEEEQEYMEELLEEKKQEYENEIKGIISLVRKYADKYGREIPVVTAGGIYTHEDVMRQIGLGADGVQEATRFVTTQECDAPDAYKQAYLDAAEEDIVIVKSPVGMPGRAIRNAFLREAEKGKVAVKRCYHCLERCDRTNIPYCITQALVNAAQGDEENALLFCGSNAWRADKLETVHEVMCELCGLPAV